MGSSSLKGPLLAIALVKLLEAVLEICFCDGPLGLTEHGPDFPHHFQGTDSYILHSLHRSKVKCKLSSCSFSDMMNDNDSGLVASDLETT